VTFTVHGSFGSPGVAWEVLVDTAVPASSAGSGAPDGVQGRIGSCVGRAGSELRIDVEARAIVVLRGVKPNGG
jgi:hypothetical protein